LVVLVRFLHTSFNYIRKGFPVVCARRTNEGGYAEAGLVDTSSMQWASELS